MAIYAVNGQGHGLVPGDLLFGGEYFRREGQFQVRLKAYSETGEDKGFIHLPIAWMLRNVTVSQPEPARTSGDEERALLAPLDPSHRPEHRDAPPRHQAVKSGVSGSLPADCYAEIKRRFDALHRGPEGSFPDSGAVADLVGSIGNDELILLLRHLKTNDEAYEASRKLARRSDLFDKLILIRGDGANYWVLRLHTYQIRRGGATTNLGTPLKDDEDNTHFHRWQLGSRFVTGGFNNVTWNVTTGHGEAINALTPEKLHTQVDDAEPSPDVQKTYTIPATKNTSGQARAAQQLGTARVTLRRSEFYMRGDVVAYPILDAHSVSAVLSPFVGTTMTLAHTGKSQSEDSYFFKAFGSEDLSTVPQLPYEKEQYDAAIDIAIVRLQLVELNAYLWQTFGLTCFSHLNSFETELLPRVAELLTLHFTSARSWSLQDWIATARSVDLDEQALVAIAGMNANTLARLLIASQSALLSRDFVADLAALGDCIRESQALKLRSTTTPVNVRSRWL